LVIKRDRFFLVVVKNASNDGFLLVFESLVSRFSLIASVAPDPILLLMDVVN
jgi:hypothetical protein